ncbi:sugar efflux transporter [Actinoplanes xinjiangensis]|uniref:SET family sugar efflux transporter-like MFS transporter n=1 Tax=Actinoplanes xinjiangensis TaxID=512350 RepID=A0A316F2E1_9ACTN|nr:sugar efflux transporter [Actinoplanes xinjiangensis]PWK39237.1 SET family sugar efflux transporter-like MFS transporter [Actinoplanes xinjiangensis]GIF43817.1 sugar efflux transporter SetB [Actinoplanes xinjiangensis]
MFLSRRLLPLGLVFLTVGIATAVVGPFLGLFLSTAVGASPIQVTFFLVAASLSGVAMSWAIGRVSDRKPMRRTILIVAALAGCAGSGLTAVVRDFWILLALTATATAIAGSLFPQSFAYARQVLQQGDPNRAAMGISALRTVFSIAWVGGPSLAAFLLEAGDFQYVYGAAAVLYLVAALLVARWLPEVEAPAAAREGETTPPPRAPWQIYPILAGFVLIQTSMVLGVQAMPLFISTELGGSVGDAGMILGVCAALEIPLMLGFGKLSTRMPLRRIILFGAVCGVAYQAVAASATSVGMLVAAQVLNAILIAAASGLGISYFQDLMPHFPGRASTMFANTFPLGQILSAPLFGLAQEFGFRLAYGLNLGLTALGLLLLLAVRPRTAEEEPALRHVADVARRTEG